MDPTGHDTFYERLPDLLFEHGEPDLLGHLGSCALCRERMLLLGRIDRLLRRRRPGRQGLNRSACSAEERRA